MRDRKLLLTALNAAVDAGKAILEVYHTDFDIITKKDQSPLTLADQKSHQIIMKHLKAFNIPILSEEGREIPYGTRKQWEKLWIVDPLDGTKEFIKRNDEFTVNIALVENKRPALGVIYLPVKDVIYYGEEGLGAFRMQDAEKRIRALIREPSIEKAVEELSRISQALPLSEENSTESIYTIVGSRSHATKELEEFVNQKQRELGEVQFISAGSSLKICLVAEGRADIYPRLGPTMEWDTAAGQAIAETAGATMTVHLSEEVMLYNKENLLNPWFVVERKR